MKSNISVAMAVYNGEKYLREQIDSILEQLLPDDELIISYDESRDNTWSIIKEYEGKFNHVNVKQNSEAGVLGNFENAIRNCKNEYIFIADQDDIWVKNKRKKVIEFFEATEADMVIHNGLHIDEKGTPISKSFFELYDINKSIIRNFIKPRYSGCCMAFRKNLVEIALPIPRNCGAYDHWLGMVGEIFGDLQFLNDCLLYHRLHSSNVTPIKRRSMAVIVRSRLSIAYNLIKRNIRKK